MRQRCGVVVRGSIKNGQMMKYDKYIKSLEMMKEPVVPKAKLDIRGVIKYARNKGVKFDDLSKDEKELFIEYINE